MKLKEIIRMASIAALALTVAAPIRAQATGDVMGRVVDDFSNPLASVAVRAADLLDGSKVHFATSDDHGRFSLTGLPVGTYRVSAETASTPWVQRTESPLVKVGAQPVEVELILVRLAELSAGGGGVSPMTIATLAAAGIASGASIYSAIRSEQASDDADAANDAANRLRAQIRVLEDAIAAARQRNEDLANALQQQLDELNRQLGDQAAQLDRLQRDNNAFRRLLRDIAEQLEDLEEELASVLR